MGFFDGFVDELVKTAAAPEGALKGLVRRLPGVASLAAVGTGGAVLGNAYGKRKGEKKGLGEGLAVGRDAAQRAYRAGVEQGAEEMRDALVRPQGGGAEG